MLLQLSFLFYRSLFGVFLLMHLALQYLKWESYTLSIGTLLMLKVIQFFIIGLYYEFIGAKRLTFYMNAGASPRAILTIVFLIDSALTILLLKAF